MSKSVYGKHVIQKTINKLIWGSGSFAYNPTSPEYQKLSEKELQDNNSSIAAKGQDGEAFYAEVLSRLQVRSDEKCPATAGIMYNKGTLELIINPEKFKALPHPFDVGVLKHECLHALMGHLSDSNRELNFREDRLIKNLAMDLAINELNNDIRNMPKIASVPEFRNQFPNIEERKSYEWYLDFLKQERAKDPTPECGTCHGTGLVKNDDNPPNGNNNQTQDEQNHSHSNGVGHCPDCNSEKHQKQAPKGAKDFLKRYAHSQHDMWDQMSDEDKKAAKAHLAELFKRCKDRAGHMPGDLAKYIDKLFEETVNWRSILRRFVANCITSSVTFTRAKLNRRYGVLVPGYKVKNKVRIAVIADTSGSTMDKQELFFAQTDHIAKHGAELFLIQCDAEVQSCEKYKVGDWKKLVIKGGGGTLFNPAIEKALELEVDGIIFFTDGDCFEDKVIDPKVPVVWAMVYNRDKPAAAKFGKAIQIE